MTEFESDPKQVLATLAEQRLSLQLSTLDLCFVTLLRITAEKQGVSAFGEEQLGDAFEQVCLAIEPETENVAAKANHAIRRLREQRLLARVDGAGVLRAGEFALTRLATAIVDFYVQSEALTRESLTLLSRTLMLSLAEILKDARSASTPEDWQARVTGPLRVTVGDLMAGIEGRQRGLDVQQEDFQRSIAQLLGTDWFGSIERCQQLLDTTASTLSELNDVLLRGSYELSAILQDLLGVITLGGDAEAERAAQQVIEQVDRISAWGASRQRAWAEYYDYVHRYLRDVVRFDPSRAMTERLRKLLAGKHGRSYSLTVAAAAPLRVLREVKPPEDPPPVRRPKKDTPPDPEQRPPEPDPRRILEEQVRAVLAEGVAELSEITRRLTKGLPETERFVVAGRVAQTLAALERPLAGADRPWVVVDETLAIEQWRVSGERN